MNEQILISISLIFALVSTLVFMIWRAKKQIENKNDERWQLVLLNTNKLAELSYGLAIIIISALMLLPSIQDQTFSMKRILIVAYVFWGVKNFIQLIGLIYYEHKL